MHSNNVFQYSKIRTRKRNAKKSIKTVKKLESGIHRAGIRNPVLGIGNPQRGVQDPRMSCIPLHGAKRWIYMRREHKTFLRFARAKKYISDFRKAFDTL